MTARLLLEDADPPALPGDVTTEISPSLEFDDEPDVERMLDVSQANPERDHGLVMTLAGLREMAPTGAVTPPGIHHVNVRLGCRPTDAAGYLRRPVDGGRADVLRPLTGLPSAPCPWS